MDAVYYFLFFILGVIIMYILFLSKQKELYKKIEQAQEGGEGYKLMLSLIEKLRADVHGGMDRNKNHLQTRLDETLKLLDRQFYGMRKTVDTRMDENAKLINQRLDASAKVIHGVKEELGRMKEIGSQIKKLQEVLGGQKLRGNLGEQIMKDLIMQVVPAAKYDFQYRFDSGEIVDAVIHTPHGFIPIDSKFPLENYRKIVEADDEISRESYQREFCKNVRKHLTDIHKKYIRPNEGTLDFAMMYVPADSIYFEIVVNNPELSDYSRQKQVYIVSPSIFYCFLQVVLMSYQSQRFEEHAREVLQMIKTVKRDSNKFGDSLSVLSRHLNNAKSKMDDVKDDYVKLDGNITNMDRGYELKGAGEKMKIKD